jgi:hypothetical protein
MTRIFAVFLLVLVLACDEPSDPPFANPSNVHDRLVSLAGCWQFESPSHDSPYLPGPLLVRFDTVVDHREFPQLLRLAVNGPVSKRVRIGYWAIPVKADRVVAFWGDGFTGIDLRLTVDGSQLRGRGYRTSDVRGSLQSSIPVVGSRAACT